MQLGARWRAGESPHRSVPSALHQEIDAQETLHPDAGAWTLTWLERLPRCALDDVALLTLDAAGHVILVNIAAGGESDASEAGVHSVDCDDSDDSDDDWLV